MTDKEKEVEAWLLQEPVNWDVNVLRQEYRDMVYSSDAIAMIENFKFERDKDDKV